MCSLASSGFTAHAGITVFEPAPVHKVKQGEEKNSSNKAN
jgi:hypothetical protein